MDIFLESRIWSDSFDFFKWQVDNATDKQVDIYIAGVGGNVDAGFAIANYIKSVNASGKKTINTHILSNADSIMTVIFLAAPKENRTIVQSSTMFVHDPRFMDLWDVTSEVAEQAAEALKVQEERIANWYVGQVEGLSYDEAKALMKGEKTLSAKDMLGYKIVSDVKEHFDIAALKTNIKSNMFGKKEPVNVVSLKQGSVEVQAIHEGVLAEKTELKRVGSMEALTGEFVIDNKKVTIADNKVTAIVNEFPPKKEDDDEIEDRITSAVEAATTPMLETIENLTNLVEKMTNQKSTHTPKKTNVNNGSESKDETKEARKASRGRQTDALKTRRENVNKRISKIS
jgi:ATP-dependent protease ClpP protease subunit